MLKQEARLRQADRDRDDLPRVRFTIEHRKFVLDNGKPTAKIDARPGGEVVVELFEDQAPNTVANFIDLVEKKFYDGTKFCLAEPASLVLGGCPRTKNADPADDGTGGPGYYIADEIKVKNSRKHFRGSLCMANSNRPDTAGSQFYFTLTPQPNMNGIFTVFGRVIKGQDVVDRITPGRTNLEVGPYGRIIPGDVIVRAEVVRKRPHVYSVKKIQGAK
ncbi:MAG: peptidylprolyl isomerase [Planctomycetes bacterium]|nr:peptidylprolyl isomerase [Planctomycetota bacterium]